MASPLRPIKFSVIPNAGSEDFTQFVNEWEHKCNDLMFYSVKWPVLKTKDNVTIRKRIREPEDKKRWFCRSVYCEGVSYNSIRKILFMRSEHSIKKISSLVSSSACIDSLAPGIAEVWHTKYSKRWGGGKRDFCDLFIRAETTDAVKAQPRGIYTPASSYVNLLAFQELANAQHSPIPIKTHKTHTNSSPISSNSNHIVRRFQVISVPLIHPKCPKNSGFTRALIESYDEVRETIDGNVEWITVQSYSPEGWVMKSIADRAYIDELYSDASNVIQMCAGRH